MAKSKGFICTACDAHHATWYGKCPNCGTWSSLEEQFEEPAFRSGNISATGTQKSTLYSLEYSGELTEERWQSQLSEFDRVLGGGAVAGTTVLLGGEPGIGKSTLMLQYAAANSMPVYYITGEETFTRIQLRAKRLGITAENVHIICDTELTRVFHTLHDVTQAIVIFDSIQTMHLAELPTQAGSISHIRYISQRLVEFSRDHHASVFIVSHVTKAGDLAGPKQLEHLVDTVLLFERGDAELRYIRATKNRFGATDELGVFSLDESGLHIVQNPSAFFQVHRPDDKAMPNGTISVPIFEGSRVFIIELQALTIATQVTAARVYSDKIDARRIARIAAVLEKTLGTSFSDQDIYINVAGGITIKDVSSDLALAMALYSARIEKPLPHRCCAVGELSLAGEVRTIPLLKQRIRAVQDFGFTHCLAPHGCEEHFSYTSIASLVDAVNSLLT